MRSLLTLGLVAGALAATAAVGQQTKVYRIGLLANTIPAAELTRGVTENPAPRLIAEGLRARGWIDGKNIRLIWKTAEGHYERRPRLIVEFVQLPVDVLVVFDAVSAQVALEKTRTIPIVCAVCSSLVDNKLVASLARPGGNLTGLSADQMELNGKRLALLKAAAPKVKRVAFLMQYTAGVDEAAAISQETQAAANALGLTVFSAPFQRLELEGAIAAAVRAGADAMVVLEFPHAFYPSVQLRFREQAVLHKLPMMQPILGAPEPGGVMAYGADILEFYRAAPRYIDRILRGTKPADIPIERPTKFEFIINLKVAKAIGLTIPPAVLAEANRIIE